VNNLLVTGGAGFIGSNFVRHVLAHEPALRIVNLDALTYAGTLENLRELPNPGHYTFVEGSICDRPLVEQLIAAHRIDTIIHFAAESHVDRSINGPGVFIETNIRGTFELLEAARACWLGRSPVVVGPVRFHHVSTDEVFGSLEPSDPPFTEQTAYAPNSPYSASKAASDHLVRSYGHTYGLPYTISNCSNNYGPYQFPEKLIPLMVVNALEGLALPIYGDGKQVRDWLYVLDHCEAILAILKGGRVGDTYNIGGNNQPTNLEIVEQICALLDELVPASPHRPHRQLRSFVTDRPGHDRRYAMNIDKVARELSWRPLHSLEDGLRATVRWYLGNSAWLKSVRVRTTYQDWMERNYKNR
jgi:dTDP-glucose 4,6-dehydratase